MSLTQAQKQKRWRQRQKKELNQLRKQRFLMDTKMYAIRDQKGECFKLALFHKTHGEAERQFRNIVNDEKNMIGQYPDDYDLYHVGSFDEQTGKIIPVDTPQHIIKAVSCKNQQ